MAIKASTTITVSCYRDTESITRYYLLQSSTSSAPDVPTENPPSDEWTDSEPGYSSGSTSTLYFCDLTEFSDGTWSYSTVSVSSSYEAAKEAYNIAIAAQKTADSTADELEEVETRTTTVESELTVVQGYIDLIVSESNITELLASGDMTLYDLVSELTVDVGTITSKVTSITTFIGDTLTTSTLESVISQSASDILLEVSENYLTSASLALTVEDGVGVLAANADYIYLTGGQLIIDTDDFTLDANGNISCGSITISSGTLDIQNSSGTSYASFGSSARLGSSSDYNLYLTSSALYLRYGTTTLSSFGSSSACLGYDSTEAIINFCKGGFYIDVSSDNVVELRNTYPMWIGKGGYSGVSNPHIKIGWNSAMEGDGVGSSAKDIVLYSESNIYLSGGITRITDGAIITFPNPDVTLRTSGSSGSYAVSFYDNSCAVFLLTLIPANQAGNSYGIFRSPAVYHLTTTTSANTTVLSSGNLARYSSSASRYKNTINYFNNIDYASAEGLTKRDYTVDESDYADDYRSILKFPVVQFHYNEGYITGEPDYDYEKYVTGFIAEDIAAICPACATYNEDGEIEAWNHMEMIPRMIAVIQDLNTDISTVNDRISSLEAQLADAQLEITALKKQLESAA